MGTGIIERKPSEQLLSITRSPFLPYGSLRRNFNDDSADENGANGKFHFVISPCNFVRRSGRVLMLRNEVK